MNNYPHPIIAREGRPFLADITTVQVAEYIARRILCHVNKTRDMLTCGQRYGFICFSLRVEVYLPLDASVKVSIGDKVRQP